MCLPQTLFFGDDQYSLLVLDHLVKHGLAIAGVITKPSPTNPLPDYCQSHNLPTFSYPSLPQPLPPNTQGLLASFGAILPADLIEQFGLPGILCLHPSLLPAYRGATPIQVALALGETRTGITLFRLTPTVDQGEIIASQEFALDNTITTPEALTTLFTIGAELYLRYLQNLPLPRANLSSPIPPILTRRFRRETGYLEWEVLQQMLTNSPISHQDTANPLLHLRLQHNPSSSLQMLADLLRALTPWPGVWSRAITTKGQLRVSLAQLDPQILIKIEGKPRPITWNDFNEYYLQGIVANH